MYGLEFGHNQQNVISWDNSLLNYFSEAARPRSDHCEPCLSFYQLAAVCFQVMAAAFFLSFFFFGFREENELRRFCSINS